MVLKAMESGNITSQESLDAEGLSPNPKNWNP
jgi:hypothetical protein